MDIYVQKNGQRRGPFPETKIREGIDAGEFAPDDLAWTNGKASWLPLSTLMRLDVTQPPPVLVTIAMTGDAGQNRSFSTPPPVVARIEPTPAVEGRWKRQYNCKRCHAPYKTFTLGRWKGTDNCGECNSRHNKVLSACFAVFLIVAFVADRIFAREYEDQIKKANAYVSSLSNPKPHATPNDNAFLFPPSTPPPTIGKGRPIVFPTIPPLAESPIPTRSFSGDEQHVGLRKSEAVFLAVYGKSHDSYQAPPPEPPGAKVDWFYNAGIYYMVLFKHDAAEDVLVIRKDGKELTEDDIHTALNAYADGETWRSTPSTEASVIRHWERDGAVANLGIHHDNGGSRGANNPDQFLQIATAEYTQQFDRGR